MAKKKPLTRDQREGLQERIRGLETRVEAMHTDMLSLKVTLQQLHEDLGGLRNALRQKFGLRVGRGST